MNEHISHRHIEKTLTGIFSISQQGSIGIKQMNKIPLRRSSRAQTDNIAWVSVMIQNRSHNMGIKPI